MDLTNEQLAVVGCDDSFQVTACAGSGKTSTLLEWVRQHPNLRTLYLAFNRSVKLEMESKAEGIKNLTVMTAHGLAYQNVMRGSKYEIRSSFTVMDVMDLLDLSELNVIAERAGGAGINEMEFAMLVLSVFNSLCYSRYLSINDEEFRAKIREEYAVKFGEQIFDLYSDFMYRCVISIWRSMKSASIPVTHDFYLKLYQVSQPKLDFDVILLDECQDSNDVMLDIIERQDCIKGFVGDACQQIYGFRNAVNAFSKLDHRSFVLSNSFRFGSEVSKLANEILSWRDALGALDTVRVNGVMEHLDDSVDSVCYIARKNITLLAKAFDLINADFELTLYFEGGFSGYTFSSNGSIWDVFNLWSGQTKKIKSRFISRFKNWDTFKEFIDKGLDHELGVLSAIVEKYRGKLPDLLHRLKSRVVDSREDAGVVLSTVHKAKGLEYDLVYILNDFIRWKDIASIITDRVERSAIREMGDVIDVDCVDLDVCSSSKELVVSGSGALEGELVEPDLDSRGVESVPLNVALKPFFIADNFDSIIEEVNMLYVAVTRARKRVDIDRSYYFDMV